MRMVLAAMVAIAPWLSAVGAEPPMSTNPLLELSPLPYHMPQFERIKVSDYVPAFEAGMREQLRELDAITHNPAPPDFQNTIVALDRSGQLLLRVGFIFDELNSNNTSPEMQQIDSEMAPKRSAHQDAIYLDRALWKRVDAVYRQHASLKLDPESLQLLQRWHARFERAGAGLADKDQARLRELNEQLASLSTRFSQNRLKATADGAVTVDNVADLDGLSAVDVSAAAQAAAARGLKDKWLI